MLKILSFLILLLSYESSYASQLKAIQAKLFIEENPSLEKIEIVRSIIDQFQSKTINQSQLDNLWNHKEARTAFMMTRFQIVNQKLYADSFDVILFNTGHYDTGYNYFLSVLNYLKTFVKNYKINDVDFIIYMREEIPENNELAEKTLNIPSFLMFRDNSSPYEKDKFLFPDPFFLKVSWKDLLDKISLANSKYKWETKIDKIFWRGATTGNFYEYNIANFSKFPRLAAVILSNLYPNIIDAEFSSFPGLQFLQNKDGAALKTIIDLLAKNKHSTINEENHLNYKYLLSMDGNSATGTRVPWIMFSNSILLKQETHKVEWFYSAIKPYIHYIPVNERLTDIFSQYNWLKNNDKEIKKISQAAHNFVKNNLMPEHIDSHVAIILNEYSKIQQDKKILVTLPEAGDMVSINNVAAMLLERKKNALKEWINKWF